MADSDSSDFQLITEWSDIEKRPKFQAVYNFANREDARGKLKKLIKPYHFKERVRCGISCCRHAHSIGYIASLADETEIIIGKDCGKSYFGVEFTEQSRLMNLKRTEAENFKFLESLYLRLDQIKKEFEDTILFSGKRGFYEIARAVDSLLKGNSILNYFLISELKNKVSTTGQIYDSVLKTDMQIGIEKQMKRNAGAKGEIEVDLYEKVAVARIECFDLLYQWYEALQLKQSLEKLINKIKDPKNLLSKDRKELIRGFRGYDKRLAELKEFCVKGNTLLQPDNLLKAQRVFSREEYKATWVKWVKSLS